MALAPMDGKAVPEKAEVWPTVDRVNRALYAILLNNYKELVAAAKALDRVLVDLGNSAAERQFQPDDWEVERHRLLTHLPERFIAAARRDSDALSAV
jgi:hypothetical protein